MEQPPIINFSSNFNSKLNADIFSTIRMRNDKRYQQNRLYTITLKDQLHGQARILYLRHFDIQNLPNATAYQDSGYNAQDTIKMLQTMFKHKNIDIFHVEWTLILLKFETRV